MENRIFGGSSLVFVLCIDLVVGQFPTVCITSDEALKAKECCPDQCGGPTRGVCSDLPNGTHISFMNPSIPNYDMQSNDDRYNWPHCFFTRGCVCKGHYYGYNCRDCHPGWTGPDCSQRKVVTRRNIKRLSVSEREEFFKLLVKAKNTLSEYAIVVSLGCEKPRFTRLSIYDTFAWQHYYVTSRSLLTPNLTVVSCLDGKMNCRATDYAHEATGFLTWHRYFILWLERALQKLSGNPNFAYPYWDWRGQPDCDVCNDDFLGANDQNGSIRTSPWFSRWQMVCWDLVQHYKDRRICDGRYEREISREPGTNKEYPTLPTYNDTSRPLLLSKYDTPNYDVFSNGGFRNALEGFVNLTTFQYQDNHYVVHNKVHLYMGFRSTMGDRVPSSANDPIFPAHHCFVDYLLEEWIRKYNGSQMDYPQSGAPLGHNRDEAIVPFFPPITHGYLMVNSKELGYTFDYFDGVPPIPITTTSGPDEVGKELSVQARIGIISAAAFFFLTCVIILVCYWNAKLRKYQKSDKPNADKVNGVRKQNIVSEDI